MEIANLSNQDQNSRKDPGGHRPAAILHGGSADFVGNGKHRTNSSGRSRYVPGISDLFRRMKAMEEIKRLAVTCDGIFRE